WQRRAGKRRPELDVVAWDKDRAQRHKTAVRQNDTAEHGAVRQHHGARMRMGAVGPAKDRIEEIVVRSVIDGRKSRITTRVAMDFDDAQILLRCLFEERYHASCGPSYAIRPPDLALLIRDQKQILNRKCMAVCSTPAAAKSYRH